MSNIELVIKIDEDIYNHMKERYMYSYATDCTTELNKVGFAVRNGMPLPKGHGDLIDAGELRLDIIAHKYSNNFCEEHNIDQSINVGMLNILIADAPTIIEADKEESEEV